MSKITIRIEEDFVADVLRPFAEEKDLELGPAMEKLASAGASRYAALARYAAAGGPPKRPPSKKKASKKKKKKQAAKKKKVAKKKSKRRAASPKV